MSAAGTPSTDPFVILPREKTRYEDQFRSLNPANGIVTGDQAKAFLLQSQLPPATLGQIWALADTDADGKMTLSEFSIACKLINLKLRGVDLPKALPAALLASSRHAAPPGLAPPRPSPPKPAPPAVPPLPAPLASSTPRASLTPPDADWSVPLPAKLKYTQLFNAHDRQRTGHLSGVQARSVMMQTKLAQPVLAQIWGLADLDSTGRLNCDEFVLAMHLCEVASLGGAVPTQLPADLVPPSFRRPSSSGHGSLGEDPAAALLLQNSFEDKRKENFERGQAELERRRKDLLAQQRKEAEERERKEREEGEKRERARLEAERRRVEGLERARREEEERRGREEEERRRLAEVRAEARREMERQMQVEWEKERVTELQQRRQREQEAVLRLKGRNQSLTIELSGLNEQVRVLSQRICDTRLGVANVKATIDGMRGTRDTQMQEMAQVKSKLKEQNGKLLSLSQERVRLEARNKVNLGEGNTGGGEQAKIAFENKEIAIRNLREKAEGMRKEVEVKLSDIDANNNQLVDLRTQLKVLVGECESLYGVYDGKRTKVVEMKSTSAASWKSDGGWGAGETKVEDWKVAETKWPTSEEDWSGKKVVDEDLGVVKYRALYEFEARNTDEVSFQPGDVINVPKKQTGEPGWLAGEVRGHTGWFPESYVEPVDGVGVREEVEEAKVIEEIENIRLEGIIEVVEPTPPTSLPQIELGEDVEYFIANYPYQSQEQGDLTFNAGEVIAVIKKDGEWWTGKVGTTVGIFPSNYVQKVDVNTTNTTTSIESSTNSERNNSIDNANAQIDNEVSQINEYKGVEGPLDAAMQANAQVMKGKKPEIASVIAPYQATSVEQLSLARGQLIMIRKKTDSGWWEGELQAKGRKRQVGWFPASYVKVLNSSGRISGRTTPVSATRMQQEIVIDKVVALFPYKALNPDELTFEKDEIISVTAREEEAWWRGELNGISGLFPSNYVTPLQPQSANLPYKKKRNDSINEFIQTERNYVDDMDIVHDVFETPLKQCRFVSLDDINRIFVNWSEIRQCNRSFLTALFDWQSTGDDYFGHVVVQHLGNMQAYETFCGRQLQSASLLQKQMETSSPFRDLVRKLENNVKTKGMPLSSFLIKPMQRITRYPLLISKIIENTPNDHVDYVYLQAALKISETFLNQINDKVKDKETQERFDWLQSCVLNDLNIVFNSETNQLGGRGLLHFGILMKLKSGKELVGILFNDFLMFIQPSKSIGSQFNFQRNNNICYKMYKQPILIQDLCISRESTIHIEQGTDSNRVLKLQDEKNKYSVCLLALTVNECHVWTKRIENAKEVCCKLLQLNQVKVLPKPHLGRSRGRLLVYVQNGRRFVSSGKPHTNNVYCKVSLGEQREQTDHSKDSNSNGNNTLTNGQPPIPMVIWNQSMQFQIKDFDNDLLKFVVLGANLYCPDEFLGNASLDMHDIMKEAQSTTGPLVKNLILHQVESGEISVKLDVHFFE